MEACSVAKDVFSLVLLGFSAQFWEGTEAAQAINTCVAVLQFMSLIGESTRTTNPGRSAENMIDLMSLP